MRSMPSGRAPTLRPRSSSSLTTRAVTTWPSLRALRRGMREDAGPEPGDVGGVAQAGIPGSYGGIRAAYLLRNLGEPNAALRSFYALLKPDAPLALHEYSVADSARSRLVWTAVCWGVIIPMGKLRAGS